MPPFPMPACDQFRGLEYNLAWSLRLEGSIVMVEVGGGSGKGVLFPLYQRNTRVKQTFL